MSYLVLITVMFLTPFLLNGIFFFLAIFIVDIFIFLIFIAIRYNRYIQKTIPNFTLSFFVVLSAILLPLSLLLVNSIQQIIWNLGYLGIFLYIQCLVKSEKILENTSKIFVLLTTLFGLVSIYKFIEIGLTSYTRLDGFIGTHNVYGGFLIIPFLLSLYLIFREGENKWIKYVWLLSNAIILSSIILTFSRGTWVSIALAVLVSVLLLMTWKRPVNNPVISIKSFFEANQRYPISLKSLKTPLILIVLTILMTSGIWFLAKQSTIHQNPANLATTAIFSQQSVEENAFTARIHYFTDAWNTFLERPVTGFGPGLYGSALRMYKTDPNYGSFADPHNWLLKMLVENGLIVTIVFLIFIVSLFWHMRRLIVKRREFPWFAAAIFTGLIGSTIHGLMDFDWSVNLLLLVFFVLAGSLYGYLLNTQETNNEERKYFPIWTNYVLVVLVLTASIVSIQTLRADLARAKGDVYFLQVGDSDTAINSYFESVLINSHEPTTYYDLWRVYYTNKKYGAAKNCILKAITLMPENGIYYGALARTDLAMGDFNEYRDHLLKAIKYFPASDLSYYVMLVDFDIKQKKYDEALSIINSALPIYEKYQAALWYKNDPNSPTIDENVAKLKESKSQILLLISSASK